MTDPRPARDDWWNRGFCSPGQPYNHLPWTTLDHVPLAQVETMLLVCQRCPVLEQCKRDLDTYGGHIGVRAGVHWASGHAGRPPRPAAKRGRPRLPPKEPTVQVKRCSWCGTEFETTRGQFRYCTQVCAHKGRRAAQAASQRRRVERERASRALTIRANPSDPSDDFGFPSEETT